MIASFGNKATDELYHGHHTARTRKIPSDVAKVTCRKLDLIEAADRLNDLASPPGNRLEALKGDRRGFYSIRVNDQWRIVFRWIQDSAHDVELTDYH